MSITLHADHERLKEEIERKRLEKTDILQRYKVSDLDDIKKIDLYFILDLPGYRFNDLPEKTLFKKYRERIVRYHPNKSDEKIFMALRDGYEILKKSYWKKKYDEYFLDEKIIENRVYSEEEFYEIFSDFFNNVSLFSKNKNIPSLGDKNTSKEKIKEFYAFWRNFESTRSFEFLSYTPNYHSLSEYAKQEHDQKLVKVKKDLFNEHVLKVREAAKICEINDPRFEREKIYVSPKLIVNGWTENDIILFERLKKKYTQGKNIDWKKFQQEFVSENKQKRTMRDFLIKNTQIERFQNDTNGNAQSSK
ncbi:Zuotin, molecular chaperone (DnaJ superfamily) [Pseudoloma neurophilia]|uniref:Zuotin, molecular chaperone (DnaJ superfamily) n=1 Tax=Pseudoloma neurophilia TaxID=146866 RepID=A0A0R0M139_9MICR|nr:Zuotin, molecular chaperone (DnaJ superfamily) [Pseudoloma neurophilia]